MKVKDLIEKLQKYDEDKEVMLEPVFGEPTNVDKVQLCSHQPYRSNIRPINYVSLWPREEIMKYYDEAVESKEDDSDE